MIIDRQFEKRNVGNLCRLNDRYECSGVVDYQCIHTCQSTCNSMQHYHASVSIFYLSASAIDNFTIRICT